MYMRFLIYTSLMGVYKQWTDAFWPPGYKVELEDHATFVISIGNSDYDDESEMEMIKPRDLVNIPSFHVYDDKYKSLHSHVKSHNRRVADEAKKQKRKQRNSMKIVDEINFTQSRPYIGGFHEDLVKHYFPTGKDTRQRRDHSPTKNPKYTQSNNTIVKTTSYDNEDMESYDYYNLHAEYYEQLEEANNKNITFNYTAKHEFDDTPKGIINKIVELKNPKNCTKQELTSFGLNALQCVMFDFTHAKKIGNFGKLMSRTWLALRIWILIYICIAIPCWCKRGWCCCCCRCAYCFPHRRILKAKKYFAFNPPGVLDQPKPKQPIKYKPTPFEVDAYEKMESRIRDL